MSTLRIIKPAAREATAAEPALVLNQLDGSGDNRLMQDLEFLLSAPTAPGHTVDDRATDRARGLHLPELRETDDTVTPATNDGSGGPGAHAADARPEGTGYEGHRPGEQDVNAESAGLTVGTEGMGDSATDPGDEDAASEVRAEIESLRQELARERAERARDADVWRAGLERVEAASAQAVHNFLEKSGGPLAELAITIAECIVDDALADETRETVVSNIHRAAEDLAGHGEIDIRVSLELYEAVAAEREAASAPGLIRWHADDELGPGEWIVDSPRASIRRIKKEMLARFREAFGCEKTDEQGPKA